MQMSGTRPSSMLRRTELPPLTQGHRYLKSAYLYIVKLVYLPVCSEWVSGGSSVWCGMEEEDRVPLIRIRVSTCVLQAQRPAGWPSANSTPGISTSSFPFYLAFIGHSAWDSYTAWIIFWRKWNGGKKCGHVISLLPLPWTWIIFTHLKGRLMWDYVWDASLQCLAIWVCIYMHTLVCVCQDFSEVCRIQSVHLKINPYNRSD